MQFFITWMHCHRLFQLLNCSLCQYFLYGYGINGSTYGAPDGAPPAVFTLPSTSISFDPNYAGMPLKQMSSMRRSADFVLMYDGIAWNPFNALTRISGGRHGKFNPASFGVHGKMGTASPVSSLAKRGHGGSKRRLLSPAFPVRMTWFGNQRGTLPGHAAGGPWLRSR